jgi:hypothetical protein
MTDQITSEDYEISSQFAHFFTAAFLVSQCGHFWGEGGLAVGAFGMLVWASIKEFWYDERYENPLVRGSSELDFAMYMAGSLLAVGLWFVRR